MCADTATPPARLSRKGVPLLKPAGGPPALTKRHLALIQFMVHGLPQAFPRWPEIAPHVPLDVNTAADVAGLRRKNARDLLNWPIFLTAYNRELASLRTGAKANALHRMIELVDDPGQGKAADRKVQLAAAQAVLGEGEGPRGTSVTVNVGPSQITAGIVIMPPPGIEHGPPTLEHEDAPA